MKLIVVGALLITKACFADESLWPIHYQIELLANLDQVPEGGAIVVVSFPKPKSVSEFPARVFAILP